MTVRGARVALSINGVDMPGTTMLSGPAWRWDAWTWQGTESGSIRVRRDGGELAIDHHDLGGTGAWARERLVAIDCASFEARRSAVVGSH